MATVAGLGKAFPGPTYRQDEIVQALGRIWPGRPEDLVRQERIYQRSGVEGRHLALPLEAYMAPSTFGETNRAWQRIGSRIGQEALETALDSSGVARGEIDALIFVTVTGLSTPSLDALMVQRLGLPSTTSRIPIFGLGCVAGAAGLARAADLARIRPRGAVALLSVELCSLTFQREDRSGANLVASAIFGDGAAAVVVTGDEHPAKGPRIVASRSILYPGTENLMGWSISEEGFKLILSPEIPVAIRKNLPGDVDAFLGEHDLTRRDIAAWIAHTGGPKIFTAIRESLELPDDALQPTVDQIRETGNVSSASVLLVLERIMRTDPPPPGAHAVLMAMGPGFCSELILLRW